MSRGAERIMMPYLAHDDLALANGSLQSTLDRRTVIGSWTWDLEEARLQADPLVALMFGVDPVLAASGAPVSSFVSGIHPDDRDRLDDIVQWACRHGAAYIAEYRVRSADGTERWVLARGNFEFDAKGMAMLCHGIIVDVTAIRDDGEEAPVNPLIAARDPLERAAEHCIAAWREVDDLPDRGLRRLIAPVLAELGRRLARRLDLRHVVERH